MSRSDALILLLCGIVGLVTGLLAGMEPTAAFVTGAAGALIGLLLRKVIG